MASKRRTNRPTPRNAKERNDQLDALAALKLMRREGLSAHRAVEIEGTTVPNLERYAGSALRKVGKDYVAKPIDDLVRPMLWLDSRGVQPIEIRGSKAASLNGQFWNAVDDALKGKRSALKGFEGRTLPGTKLKFLTDFRIIRRLQDAGQLDNIKEIYWHGRRR
jgi:hypothetical protein